MRTGVRATPLTVVVAGLLAGIVAPAGAQSLWLDREARTSVRVETLAPRFESYDGAGTGPYAAFVTVRAPLGRSVSAVVEGSYTQGGLEPETYAVDDYGPIFAGGTTFGNPYVGIEFAPAINGMHYELGLRPPVARRSASAAPAIGDAGGVDAQPAFLDHTYATRLGALYHHAARARSPIGYDARLAATWQVPTAEPAWPARFDDAFPFNLYFASRPLRDRHALYVEQEVDVRLEGPHASLGVGWSGRWLSNNDVGGFAANSIQELSMALEIRRGPVHPGFMLRAPLDSDLKSVLRGAIGASLTVVGGRQAR